MKLNLKYCLWFCIFFFVLMAARPKNLAAQSLPLTSGSGSLAGGTHYQNLINPANLYVQNQKYKTRISLLQGGYLSFTPGPAEPVSSHIQRMFDPIYWRNNGQESEVLTPQAREQLVRENFGEHSSAQFFNQAEVNWVHIHWHGAKRSYAVSLKTRYASRFNISRELFSYEPAEGSLSRSFTQQSQVLHEISFATAESLTYLSGMLPVLSQFVAGISPKLIIAGDYNSLHINEQSVYSAAGNTWTSGISYHQQAAGYLTRFASGAVQGNPVPGITRSKLLNPSGYGFGLDAGISYIITLGDDLSLLNRDSENLRKALRFNLSLTDIGAMVYTSQTFDADTGPDHSVSESPEPPPTAGRMFYGAPGEYIHFLEPFGLPSLQNVQTELDESFAVYLPSAAHAGIDLRYNRFSVDAFTHYYFQDQAFSAAGLLINGGVEFRPVPLLAFNAGAGFSQHQPGYYTGGARLHTSRFEMNASAVLLARGGSGNYLFGGAMAGMSFYLN